MQNLNHYLETILHHKQKEVQKLLQTVRRQPSHPLNRAIHYEESPTGGFAKALQGDGLQVIAEVKRRSPALGELGIISDPVALANDYCKGGASAISVLTDPYGFGGSILDLHQVSSELTLPTLRKDFIIHPLQLAEAKLAGASASLLIARVLANRLKMFINEATRIGLETLVEINDEHDLEIALKAGARIIGVNHRDLSTFQVDLSLSQRLKPLIPNTIITVAASGIHTPDQANQMRALGYDAILVGEALVKARNPAKLILQMKESSHAY